MLKIVQHHEVFSYHSLMTVSSSHKSISAAMSCHSEDDVLTHHNIDSCAHSTSPNDPRYFIVHFGCPRYRVLAIQIITFVDDRRSIFAPKNATERRLSNSACIQAPNEGIPAPKHFHIYIQYHLVMKRRRHGRVDSTRVDSFRHVEKDLLSRHVASHIQNYMQKI